ncbi:TlyA family RNA methyltransferase [Proteocatella sphenisci]|uniref:TlyA family RNA methyltransferase n=1 Tax=Proteocatella sphenisci TaxID=181070 RepID=UPI00048B0773|nr:TlyA family RNA methyltransferase [Proteocatella sphenisci]
MKERIDKILVDRGLFDSRERAKKNIMAGTVLVNNMVIDKAGFLIDTEAEIRIKNDAIPYVSRGGLKLEKVMNSLEISLDNKVCMDIGSSTGGFTDCMLQNGAKKVYAVDVGYGQLDWKLRNDSRVKVMERTNIRNVTLENLEDKIQFFSIDVSFISLKLVLPKIKELGDDNFECIALIKPQFEVGREEVGKNGVVRDPEKHLKAIVKCIGHALEIGLHLTGLDYSPIKGPKGNIEFLMLLSNNSENEITDTNQEAENVVKSAHFKLDK